jgi:inner membrane protein
MPTILTHPAAPIAMAISLGKTRLPLSMLAVGVLCSILPDADGVTFRLGIPYGSIWGHRGFTHSLGFALAIGMIGILLAQRWRVSKTQAFLWLSLCTFSHPLLDAFTNGGEGVPLLWPLLEQRFFSPWRPIEVSPVSLHRFLSGRGLNVLLSELKWVWLPLLSLGVMAGWSRRKLVTTK